MTIRYKDKEEKWRVTDCTEIEIEGVCEARVNNEKWIIKES